MKHLLQRSQWAKVVVIGRRHFNPMDYNLQLRDEQMNKLENVVIEDVEMDLDLAKDKFRGVDTVFNCIGTTRKAAGGAEGFVRIEHGITEKVAQISKDCGVNHVSVVSAQGASTKVPAVSWLHPLLYAVSDKSATCFSL